MSSVRSALRRWLPLALRRWWRRRWHPALYQGDFATWAEAQQASRGYDDPAIMNRVVAATRAVRDARAAWERDTVLFNEPAANPPVLRALLRAAEQRAGRLHVLDFGGALGSTWWQHRPWLGPLNAIRWTIVEQPAWVEIGRREFAVGPLEFRESLDAAWADGPPDVVLLSSVLPYLPEPHAFLADLHRRAPRHVIIDRTGILTGRRDRLTVQHVPPEIYEASYPCWFFARDPLLARWQSDYRVVEEWTTADDCDIDARHGGVALERRET